MLVTLKTLQEDIFAVDIDPKQTVKYLKEKIEKIKGDEFPAKNMKLMYAGKFLVDSNRISDYNVEEKKFIIVFVKKPKTVTVKEEEPESSTDIPHDRSAQRNTQRNAQRNGQRNNTEPNRLCNEHEALVSHIVELGFTRAEVEAALCASFNNPDRAVEYLINGVLPSSSNNAPSDSRRRDPDNITGDPTDAHLLRHISMSGPPSPGSANMPNQERIMQLFTEAMDECENQTRAADSLLEEDHDLITQSFAEMEAADICRSSGTTASASTSMPSMPMDGIPDSSMFSSDRMFNSFSSAFHEAQALSFAGNLMDKDHEAIARLKQLGFSDHKAIEAYFVCERNENAAADYLFSQNFE